MNGDVEYFTYLVQFDHFYVINANFVAVVQTFSKTNISYQAKCDIIKIHLEILDS